jgi:hypothetical protein
LTGLLFDDAGHRMVPTHATKAGIRYRYYASLPHLKGESKITPVGSVSRVAASEIEDAVVTALDQYLAANVEAPNSNGSAAANCTAVRETIERVDVAADRLTIRLRPGIPGSGDASNREAADRPSFSTPWGKVPSRKSRQIIIPHGVPRDQVRPTRIERRARLVSAIARGHRWLDEIVSGKIADVRKIAARERCSERHVNMTISLAFLAPGLVKAAVDGRLPRGLGVERLRDAPVEWSLQFETLGLAPR